jgi:TRAP-type C4-dicarboxylate transport system substrate-binding protein
MKYLSLICFLIFSLATPTFAATLKISTLSPDGSFWVKKLKEGAAAVKKETNGRVKIKIYPGGVMGADKSVLKKMRFGQLQGTAITNASLNVYYPDIQLYNMVLKFDSLEEVDKAREKLDPVLEEGLLENGIVSLGFAEIGFAYLMSTQRVANLDDLKRLKAWVPENNYVAEAAINALGVSPVPLPIRDVLMGLKTGMVDVVAGSPIGALTLQWHTTVKYFIDLPVIYIFAVLAIDEKAFNKLKPADQEIVRREMGKVIADVDMQNRKDNAEAIETLKKQGVEIITLDKKERQRIKQTIEEANESLMQAGHISPDMVKRLDAVLSKAE